MKNKIFKLFLLTAFLGVSNLSFVSSTWAAGNDVPFCTIDISQKYQTIQNFGASDCWSGQFVGRWPEKKKNAIADLLFSQQLDKDGKPKGIGLSLGRFNIGGGSAEQGKASLINNPWRRAECFQNPDGTYDWNKQAGQQWFLKAAKERGVKQFLGFAITAPVQMTQNGLALNKGRPETFNLKADKYDAYADFLAQVVKGVYEHTGVLLNYLSPFNEPEWDWSSSGQEGTPALDSEIAKEVRALDRKLSGYHLNTKIVITESGKLDYMYKSGTDKPARDNQINRFFNPASPDYVGNLEHVPDFIGGHDYWTLNPVSTMIRKRKELHQVLVQNKIGFWQTEVCLMEKVPGVGDGHGRDLTMNTALFFARLIHHDLVIANARAWQWWLALSKSNYKDGLIYIFPDKDKLNGRFVTSKLFWTLGNFSRFVRPGSIRVGASSNRLNINDPDGLMVSAYWRPKAKQIVTVAINYGHQDSRFRLAFPGVHIHKVVPYLTSDKKENNLYPEKELGASRDAVVPSRSVVTFVCSYD